MCNVDFLERDPPAAIRRSPRRWRPAIDRDVMLGPNRRYQSAVEFKAAIQQVLV